ncbi:MAG: hypothetical protein J6X66_02440, partial [Lachnospiraceae bacterium]|nr:hypothetical protein [Lachnospiraceae bacterium]
MDNFMDKLAEKYNAQDMIRANSQAESAQMQNLQEQVEAYEAVLQEMRKLNYKNTELTEKMYALVDESIEKVRTLQIEAEGGANTELVSKEMSDAVNRAMSEAVSNLDDTMVRSLTQTLENALVQPADQLRQSTEDVKNSVVAVQSSADDMRSGVDSVKNSVDQLGTGIDGIKSGMEDLTAGMELVTSGMENVKGSVDQLSDGVGSVKDEIGGIQDKLFAIQQTGSNTEDTLSMVAAAVKELGEQLDRMQKETIEGITDQMEGIKNMPSEEKGPDNEALEKISASIEELKQQAQLGNLIQETLSALTQSDSKTMDSLTELKTAVGNLKDGNNSSLEAAKAAADAGEAAKNGLAELKNANEE